MQWMCRSSTSTPPRGPQPGTRNGHVHRTRDPGTIRGCSSSSSSSTRSMSSKEGTGSSTNCPTSCGSRHKRRAGMSSRMILGTSITCSGHSVSKKRPSAAQGRQESAAQARCRRSGPRGAAEPAPAAVRPGAPELQHTVVVVERKVLCTGLVGEECFRNFAVYCVSYSSPGPCLLLST